MATLLSACSQPHPVQIPFVLTYHDDAIDCARTGNVQLTDMRFYLHDIQLQNSAGKWQKLTLDPQSPWQDNSTALLDFEDASNHCQLGTASLNRQISGFIPQGEYRGLRFVVGVPFDKNHANPLTAGAPLNDSSMHWHWQGGYKFLRAEFLLEGKAKHLHIGSLQCKGEIDAISHCEKPNRPTIALDNYELTQTVEVRLDNLLDKVDSGDKDGLTCMGNDEHPWCANALEWIGLDEQPQSAFAVQEQQP